MVLQVDRAIGDSKSFSVRNLHESGFITLGALPRQGQRTMFREPQARLRISCRLCIRAAVCSMRNKGTRNAGIRSSGSVAIGAVLISPGAPVAKKALAVPMLTAMRRSNIPRTFHLINVPLAAKRG